MPGISGFARSLRAGCEDGVAHPFGMAGGHGEVAGRATEPDLLGARGLIRMSCLRMLDPAGEIALGQDPREPEHVARRHAAVLPTVVQSRRESRPERELSGVRVEFDILEHPRRRVARGTVAHQKQAEEFVALPPEVDLVPVLMLDAEPPFLERPP